MLATMKSTQAIWQSNLPATPVLVTHGLLVTADATIHTKGAWATVMTTTYDVYGFWLQVYATGGSNTRTDVLLDLAIGAAQENIILPNWLCGWRGTPTTTYPPWVYFPIFIPRGVLVSARIQALITVDTARVVMFANGGTSGQPGPLFTGCDAYGIDTAASIGTSHTPGDSGAESTAADIGAVLATNYGAVLLGLGGTLADTAMSNECYHWECVVGGNVICEWFSFTNGNEVQAGPFPPTPFLVSLPAGTQLQIQAECSGTAKPQDVAWYAFY